MAELFDWTAGIDQQTAQNNLKASPEGQMARQRGLAELALVQGQAQEQQMRIQADQSRMQMQKQVPQILAQMAAGRKAQAEAPARAPGIVADIQQSVEEDRALANAFIKAGLVDEGRKYQERALKNEEQALKLQNMPMERLEKQNAFLSSQVKRVEQAAGAALTTKNGVANYVKEMQSVKKEMQDAGVPMDAELEQLLSMPPTPENLRYIQMHGATIKDQLKHNESAIGTAKNASFDDFNQKREASQATATKAEQRAQAAVEAARRSEGGAIEKPASNYSKNWGEGWDQLSDDQKVIQTGLIQKTAAKIRAGSNAASTPRNIDAVATAIVKREFQQQMATIKGAQDANLPPGEGQKYSDSQLQNEADKFAAMARSKDKKSSLGGVPLLQQAKEFMAGQPNPYAKGSPNAIALESMVSRLKENGMKVETPQEEKLGPYVRSVANEFNMDQHKLVGMDALEKHSFTAAAKSMKNIEDIGNFMSTHQDAVGTLAAVIKKANSLSYNLFNNNQSVSPEEAADKFNRENNITGDVAVLNKMLITQSLADVQATAGGRMNQFLEKTMVSLYDQSLSEGTLERVIYKRQEEAFRTIQGADDSLTKKNVPKSKYPFFHKDLEGENTPSKTSSGASVSNW